MKPLGEDRRENSDIGLANSQHWNLMASGKLDLVLGFCHAIRTIGKPNASTNERSTAAANPCRRGGSAYSCLPNAHDRAVVMNSSTIH
jgi:hypothetical protein